MKLKYPRTFHCPWSEGATNDDKILKDMSSFLGKEVVVTIKMDGENTTLGRDYMHARSLDSAHHPSRDWVKAFHATFKHRLGHDFRICGENLYAKHSIHYNELESYFLAFSTWEDRWCSHWDETKGYCDLLGIKMVREIYRGTFNNEVTMKIVLQRLYEADDGDDIKEGYVIRLVDSFHYDDFKQSVAKFVNIILPIKSGF